MDVLQDPSLFVVRNWKKFPFYLMLFVSFGFIVIVVFNKVTRQNVTLKNCGWKKEECYTEIESSQT